MLKLINHVKQQKRFWRMLSSLRLRLFFLTTLTMLPALGLGVYVTNQQQQLVTIQAQENILKQTRASANLYEQILEGTRILMPSLVRISAVQNHDAEACTAIFAGLLSQYPSYANLAAVDTTGDMYCSVIPIPETRINVADRVYFQRTLTEKTFVIGEYQVSRITGEPVVTMAFPVLDSAKQTRGLVFAGLSLTWLNRQVDTLDLPVGATLRLVDSKGTVLVHSLDSSHWLGKSIPETQVWQSMQTRREGWIETKDADGVRRLYTFAPVSVTADADMYVIIDIPAEIVYADSSQILFRNLIALASVGVFALAAGRVAGDLFILRRVNRLLAATKQVAAGNLSVRTRMPYEGGELSELARSFDHMAASLEQRAVERQRMEDALRASTHRAEAIARAAGNLNAQLELTDVLETICRESSQVFNVPAASVCLYDQKNDWFDVTVTHGLPLRFRDELQQIPRQVYDRIALAIGSPIVIADVNADTTLPYGDLFRELGICAMACAMLKHQENLVGILSIFTFQPRDFSPEDLILLRGLADQAALAAANARLYHSLRQQEQARASLLRKTISVQEDERMRIARELHDETSQNLTAMMVGLDTAKLVIKTNLDKAQNQIESARSIAMNMLHGIHRLIADLRPSLLDHRGLVPAIVWYGEQRLKPLNIELHLEENLDGHRLPTDIETCFFRIVQEGITNIIRYAQASQVTIKLLRQDGWLMLQIIDNGQGFDANVLRSPDELGKGLGLQGMQERATILDGDFDLKTAPGQGTTITVRVPMPNREE